MRKRLLAGVAALAALAVLAAPTQPARAVLGVGDVVFDPANLEQAIHQFEEMRRQYEMLERQWNTAENTFNSLRRANGIVGLAQKLLGLRSPLGDDGRSIVRLLRGQPGGLLGGLFREHRDEILVYENPADHWFAREQNRRRDAIAGQMAAAEGLMEQAIEKTPLIQELQDAIHDEQDPGARLALIARLNAEQLHIQNLSVKVNAVREFARAQDLAFEQRRKEAIQQELDDVVLALEADRGARFEGGGGGGGEPSRFNPGPLVSSR